MYSGGNEAAGSDMLDMPVLGSLAGPLSEMRLQWSKQVQAEGRPMPGRIMVT